MSFQDLVYSCLYNWLGYGNINGSVWFIGTEEGGAEIWREKTQTLESSLKHRKNFQLSMDFKKVWEDIYKINLSNFKGITVWHFMARFLLSLEDSKRDTENIRDYLFEDKKLGLLSSNHFLCELLPLPKRKKDNIDDYKEIWNSIDKYYKEVIPKRFNLINETILEHKNIKLIVSYEKMLSKKILDYYSKNIKFEKEWNIRNKKYDLYKVLLIDDREVFLLITPFFGVGQISYEGIDLVAQHVKELI